MPSLRSAGESLACKRSTAVAAMSHPLVAASVDEQRLAGEVRGAFGGEPDDRVGNLFRAAPASDFGARSPVALVLSFGNAPRPRLDSGELLHALCVGVAGADVVKQDPVAAEFV